MYYVKTGNHHRRRSLLAALLTISVLAGCSGEEEPYRKETSGLTGQVFIDGSPISAREPVKVDCINVAGFDTKHPTISSALTGEYGRFEISTYESGDGVPEGDYVLTFMWGKLNLIAGSYDGPDKLKGAYSDPKTSTFKVSVKQGAPTDLGIIELEIPKDSKKKK
ncbi:MAG: hypothetical protein RIK87_03900 [Fuerstiella sp.]